MYIYITNTNSGNECINELINFVDNVKNLHVFACDVCSPVPLSEEMSGEKHQLIKLWQTGVNMISENGIFEYDFTYKYINALRYNLETLSDIFRRAGLRSLRMQTSCIQQKQWSSMKFNEAISKLVPNELNDSDVYTFSELIMWWMILFCFINLCHFTATYISHVLKDIGKLK